MQGPEAGMSLDQETERRSELYEDSEGEGRGVELERVAGQP